jgi:type IV fimbrial biogenesis protein FimT
MMSTKPAAGLTLVETLITLAVVGVLVALVAPSARGLIARQRLLGMQAELLGDLQFARSESLRRGANAPGIVVQFGGNADIACYAVLTTGAANCLCTKRPAPICFPKGEREELKIVQIDRATGVDLAAAGASAAAEPDGVVLGEIAYAAPLATVQPADLAIDLQSDHGGKLRVIVNAMGRPNVCSPDGSHSGVSRC